MAENYVAALHGRGLFSLENTTAERARQFDTGRLPFVQDGLLTFPVVAEITRAKPLSGER